MCVDRINNFLGDLPFESVLSESGEVEVSYSAYSCDSSFYSKVVYRFCPFCGQPISMIFDLIKKKKEKEDKKRLALEEEARQRFEEREKLRLEEKAIKDANQPKIWAENVLNGDYNVYKFEHNFFKAYSKKHLKSLLNLTNNEVDKAVHVSTYRNNILTKHK